MQKIIFYYWKNSKIPKVPSSAFHTVILQELEGAEWLPSCSTSRSKHLSQLFTQLILQELLYQFEATTFTQLLYKMKHQPLRQLSTSWSNNSHISTLQDEVPTSLNWARSTDLSKSFMTKVWWKTESLSSFLLFLLLAGLPGDLEGLWKVPDGPTGIQKKSAELGIWGL